MATKFKCSDGIYTVLKNGLAVAIDATAGTAIAAISGSGTFTVIRNGKVIASSALAAAAVSAIVADASNVVCPPECCMAAEIALDAFDLTVTTGGDTTSLSVRVTITHNEDTYSTAWEAAAASNVFDLTTLIVEVGGWFSGDTICVEYSYDEAEIIEACCATVITEEYVEDDTYDLTELVRDCPFTQTSGFDLLYQNPDGGVTVSADGEMVVPDIDDDETVFVARNCNGCLTELLVLSVTDVPLELGLRLTYTPGNLPANNLAAWNAFFDLPANGTAFTSMSVTGDEVTLIGGGGITLKPSLFRTSDKILKIEDDVDCVVAIAGGEDLGALSLCDNLATVTLNGVIAVGEQGLSFNAALTTINLSACTSAGIAAFAACTAATTFALPELLTAGRACFLQCTSATTFTLPKLTTAGDDCFSSCTSATTFTLPLLIIANSNCFAACTAATTFALPELLTAGSECFAACTAATTFTLPLLTTAGNSCFQNCTAATTFTLPLLTTAGNSCFQNCTAATTFTLPELLTAGDYCFFSCTSNVAFNIPKLTTANIECFKACTSATTFTLPLCTTVGDICFGGCTSVATIDLSACTALGISTGDNDVFDVIIGNTITITVPTALSTCDSGNPDGDLVELDANNTATINYI